MAHAGKSGPQVVSAFIAIAFAHQEAVFLDEAGTDILADMPLETIGALSDDLLFSLSILAA